MLSSLNTQRQGKESAGVIFATDARPSRGEPPITLTTGQRLVNHSFFFCHCFVFVFFFFTLNQEFGMRCEAAASRRAAAEAAGRRLGGGGGGRRGLTDTLTLSN